TSSPTYPASVRAVASAIAKGTFKILASVWASCVFPQPVGPIRSILLFCLAISYFKIDSPYFPLVLWLYTTTDRTFFAFSCPTTYSLRVGYISAGFGRSLKSISFSSFSSSSIISLHRSMHSSHIYTPGPAISLRTWFCGLLQKEHFRKSLFL